MEYSLDGRERSDRSLVTENGLHYVSGKYTQKTRIGVGVFWDLVERMLGQDI